MTFGELVKKIKKIDVNKIFEKSLKQKGIANWLIEEITGRIYATGQTDTGKQLKTDASFGSLHYAVSTAKIKQKQGAKFSNVTLYDTGRFYESYKVIVKKFSVEISANFKTKSGTIYDNFQTSFGSENDFENAVTGLQPSEIEDFIFNVINKYFSENLYEAI